MDKLYAIFLGLIMLLIPLLLAGGCFSLAICKIPIHYSKRNIGWIFFYSMMIALGFAILLFWSGPGPLVLRK